MKPNKEAPYGVDNAVQEAKERLQIGKRGWSRTWSNFDLNLRFLTDDQWDPEIKKARGVNRPAVSINLIRPKVGQVVNQFRANRPGPKVSPVDSVNDPQMADVHEGLLRHTDYVSNAPVAYDTCYRYSAAGGFGVFGLTYDYVAGSMKMQCRVRRFKDPKTVIFDPSYQDPAAGDAKWVLVRQRIGKKEYERKYGDSELVANEWYCEGDDVGDWIEEENVWIAEYWTVEHETKTLVEVQDGFALYSDDPRLKDMDLSQYPSREEQVPFVRQRIINGVEVLDKKDIPCSAIPIWIVVADETVVEGETVVAGMIDDMRTPAMMLNYAESLNIEAMAMAPKPKWLGAEGQFEGFEDQFATANVSNDAYLQYKPVSLNGTSVPPPQFVVFEPKSQSMDVAASRASDYMKAVSGQYDSLAGNIDPRAHSGKAIQALQSAGANATSHIAENFEHALMLRYQAEIEINSKIMSPGDMVRILGEDHKSNVQQLTQSFFDGKYDVVVSSGPSKETQRDAVRDFVLQLPQSDPQGWALVRDIGAQLMDMGPLGDKIAKRWTPPGTDDQSNLPPEVKQQVQQMQQQMQQLQGQLQQATHIIQTKKVEEDGKFEREMAVKNIDYRKAELQADVALRVAELNAKNAQLVPLIEGRVRQIEAVLGYTHQANMQDAKLGHDMAMAAAGAADASDKAEVVHQQNMEAQQQQQAAQQQQETQNTNE